MMDYETCRKELERRLKPSRYRHSLGVADTAAKLAARFDVDIERARLAGLLHDNARELRMEDMVGEARHVGIPVEAIDEAMPLLLHAPLGAKRLSTVYGIDDDEIARAVRLHTVGGGSMTPLDKIIYYADMIEPNRAYGEVYILQQYAEDKTLDEMLLAGLTRSIAYVIRRGGVIHPHTVLARNELLYTLGQDHPLGRLSAPWPVA